MTRTRDLTQLPGCARTGFRTRRPCPEPAVVQQDHPLRWANRLMCGPDLSILSPRCEPGSHIPTSEVRQEVNERG